MLIPLSKSLPAFILVKAGHSQREAKRILQIFKESISSATRSFFSFWKTTEIVRCITLDAPWISLYRIFIGMRFNFWSQIRIQHAQKPRNPLKMLENSFSYAIQLLDIHRKIISTKRLMAWIKAKKYRCTSRRSSLQIANLTLSIFA